MAASNLLSQPPTLAHSKHLKLFSTTFATSLISPFKLKPLSASLRARPSQGSPVYAGAQNPQIGALF
ncbi:diaminopimelate decarboxylase 1, chloroplastic-like [Salvia divinorum]|uniref:Diaminopimelate decarboxylase 1, chloroplastic-like n=1 Tax=Salvia divinorum TaxID=28513 RepID=A0ABD1GJF5_SALDI